MKKLLISATVALSLFCAGTAISHHEVAQANITLPEHKMNYHNNYKKNKLNYVKSIKLYSIVNGKAESPGYAFFDNQNNLKFNPNKTKKISGVTYIYTNFLGGTWAKLSDWKTFQKELTKFKTDYKKYHAKHGYKKTVKKHHKKASASKQNNSSNNSSKDNSSNQTSPNDSSNQISSDSSNDDNSNSQSTPTINNDANYEAAYRAEALSEINALRASVGVSPLTEDPTLDKIADMRVAQNMARTDGSISHYDDNGNLLADVDAKQMGLNSSLAENLAMRSLNDGDSTAAKDVASSLTHQYIDEGPQNNDGKEHGHYENLVDPDYKKIGIGFGINTKPDSSGFINLYDAEDFSDVDPANSTNNSGAISNNSTNSSDNPTTTNQSNNIGTTSSNTTTSIPQNTPYMTYTPLPGGGWVGNPTALQKQITDQKFYATHHTETAPDGVQVFVENGKHLDATGQVVNN